MGFGELLTRAEFWYTTPMEKLPNFEKEIVFEVPLPDDIEGIKRVWYEAWLDTHPNEDVGVTEEDVHDRFKGFFTPESLERGREGLKNIPENETFVVAKEGDKVIGLCRLVKTDTENRLQSIYVLPDFQGKGVGKMLWENVKDDLDHEKPTYVALADYNERARAFYEKIGFKDTGRRWSDPKWKMKSGVIIPEMEMELKVG